jgi:histidinol-phosphate aminotransferase
MNQPIENLIPEYIRGLPVYVPGRPIEDVERELKIRAIKLASNENPLGPSPKAIEAVRRVLPESNRYPDGGTLRLREKLAQIHGVQPEEIFTSLGSSEILDLAARITLTAGRSGATSEGSYAPYSIAIRAAGAQLLRSRMHGYAYDLEALAATITSETTIVYIANPNNPTGTAVGAAEFAQFLDRVPPTVLVVLDEAYIHYADPARMPRSVELFRQRQNLLILRTFSKIYGLAGLRIGYGIVRANIAAAMNKLKTPFNTSGVAQAAALAALDDAEHVRSSVEANAGERARVAGELTKLGLRVAPSQTNFLFIEIGPRAEELYTELLHEGVIVRPLKWMGFPEAIRISLGTREENDKFLAALTHCLTAASKK